MGNKMKQKYSCAVPSCKHRWHKTRQCPNGRGRTAVLFVEPSHTRKPERFQTRTTFDAFKNAKYGYSATLFTKMLTSNFKGELQKMLGQHNKLTITFVKTKRGTWKVVNKERVILSHPQGSEPQLEKVWEKITEAENRTLANLNHPSTQELLPSQVKKLVIKTTLGGVVTTFG